MATRLAVFDFDGTLFRSPQKPVWWPWQGYWGRPESLAPPYVPDAPDASWWAEEVVGAAREALADPDAHVIVLTGRPEKFTSRVTALLLSAGLDFHGCYCVGSGAGNTLDMKQVCLQQLIRLKGIKRVDMWEDRPEHVEPFLAFLATQTSEFQVNLVPRASREFDYVPEGTVPA